METLLRIMWAFGAEWAVGLCGCLVTRGALRLRPDDLAFEVFAWLWIVGGAGFVLLALAGLARTALPSDRAPG